MEEHVVELGNEVAMGMDESTNPSSGPVSSESWVLVLRGGCRKGVSVNKIMQSDNGSRYSDGYYASLELSVRDSDEGDVVDRVSSEEQGGEEIRTQEERHHGGASKISAQLLANKRSGHKMTGKASAAGPAGGSDSMGDDFDSSNARHRYSHQGSWSSANRFRSTVRCEELQKKLRSHLRTLSRERQSTRVSASFDFFGRSIQKLI
jgi:hypothetical protein